MPAAVARREGRARSRTRSGWCSSATRRSTRRATRARSCGSCTTWSSACSAHYAGSRPSATGRSSTSPGTTRSTATIARARRRGGAQGDQRLRRRRPASPVAGFARARGRRLDGLRLLDLLRRASPTASTRPAAATRATSTTPRAARSRPSGRGRGRRTAASSTTAPRADPEGKPWSERKKYVWWDEEAGKWTGYDVPDFPVDKPPGYRPPTDAKGMDAIGGADPFIMMADGTRLAVRAQRACSTARCRRTTSRSSRRSHNLALPGDRRATRRRCAGSRPDNPLHADRRPALPARGHDLPAHRAPHRGRR